jgi:pyruvate dehydrogenase E2 component (dihydrolipoamide acetyltransferase)
MATEFKMPQLGETVVEGTITKWLKGEGDAVEVDEPLVEVSTDKVDSEIPSPAAGTVVKIRAQEGDTVKVGDVIAEIGDSGAAGEEKAAPEPKEEPKENEAPDEPEEAPQAPPEEPAAAEKETEREEAPREEPAEEPAKAPAAEPARLEATEEEPRRGILSPLVRRLAQEHDVDLSQVRGSGTGGRITKRDVMGHVGREAPAPAAAAQPATTEPQEAPAAAAGEGEEVVEISHMRKAIAEHMVTSIRETARAWNTVEVDMSGIARLRAEAGEAFKAREGFSLTWMPFVSKAITQVLLKYPNVNSTWNGDGTVTRKNYVNLGIAVALENGLIVPVIKGADGMNLVGLARAVRDLAQRARNKKLSPDDVAGGTFTITNPGPFGSILSVPIINRGQTGILAFDAVTKRPVVVTDEHGEDSIAIRHMVYLSMSWDHRVIDGAEASMFLRDFKQLLEAADFTSDLSAYIGSHAEER